MELPLCRALSHYYFKQAFFYTGPVASGQSKMLDTVADIIDAAGHDPGVV